jgi:hypothetical protein
VIQTAIVPTMKMKEIMLIVIFHLVAFHVIQHISNAILVEHAFPVDGNVMELLIVKIFLMNKDVNKEIVQNQSFVAMMVAVLWDH